MTVACIVIASAKRQRLLEEFVVPSALALPFAEVLVVGDFHSGHGYRYLPVPPLSATTNDALVKRDVGTLASKADWLFYVCDDHAVATTGEPPKDWLDIGVPRRFCINNGERIPLNMGFPEGYCGGHAGLFSRKLITLFPWTAQQHHRSWDLLSSDVFTMFGARLVDLPAWTIQDLEPEREPWK